MKVVLSVLALGLITATSAFAIGGSKAPYYSCVAQDASGNKFGAWAYNKEVAADKAVYACTMQSRSGDCFFRSCTRRVNR